MKNKPLVVNLLAGPGASKSTMASGLFYKLKTSSITCELVAEFAKKCTWENNITALTDQFYVTATQHYRQHILMDKVDIIVTDSPLLLGLLYFKHEDPIICNAFETLIVQYFKNQNNLNFFIERKKNYNPVGRNQTEQEALDIDLKTKELLNKHNISFESVEGTEKGLEIIYNLVMYNKTISNINKKETDQ